MQIHLPRALSCYGNDSFEHVLKSEIQQLPPQHLPLHKATTQGGFIEDSPVSVTVLEHSSDTQCVQIKIGVFFNELVGGCNCDDDPVACNSFCNIQVSIDKVTAQSQFTLLHE